MRAKCESQHSVEHVIKLTSEIKSVNAKPLKPLIYIPLVANNHETAVDIGRL